MYFGDLFESIFKGKIDKSTNISTNLKAVTTRNIAQNIKNIAEH